VTINRVVYIPSRGRAHNIDKVVPRWLLQRYQPRIVIEASDWEEYNALRASRIESDGAWQFVRLIKLPESGMGIGYARQFALQHAAGYDAHRKSYCRNHDAVSSFIMADDDVMPKVPGNLWAHHMIRLQQAVDNTGYIGCAAVHSYQDLICGGFLKKDFAFDHKTSNGVSVKGRPCIAPNGSFGQCFAVNTQSAIHIGGFDPELTVAYEDNDFMMRCISKGVPWLFHSGVWMDRLGGRFAAGGISDYCDVSQSTAKQVNKDIHYLISQGCEYSQKLLDCRIRMKSKWDYYTSDPHGKAFRISWKKLYDGQIPSWRSQSALHGGKLTQLRVKHR
jgi:hypothetical protein